MEDSSILKRPYPTWIRHDESEDRLLPHEQRPSKQRSTYRMMRTASVTLTFCFMVLILLTLLTLLLADKDFFASAEHDDVVLGSKAGLYPNPLVLGDCGNNPVQARDNGCVFDIMLAHWVSPLCFDEATHNSYLEARSWSWYHDISFEQEVSRERVLEGDLPGTWITLEFHFFHCAYLWQLQMKAYTTGGPLVEYLWSYEHTAHCAKAISTQAIPGANVSYAKTGFTRCILPRFSDSDVGWTTPPDE